MKRNKLLYTLLAVSPLILLSCKARIEDSPSASTNQTSSILNKFTLELNPNGGKVNGSEEVYYLTFTEGEKVNLPIPERESYLFDGWFDESQNKVETDFIISKDMKLIAAWSKPEVNITLEANGGTIDSSSHSIKYGDEFTLPVPKKTHQDFLGWYVGDEQITDSEGKSLKSSSFSIDMTLTAKYKESEKVTIEFYVDSIKKQESQIYLDDDIGAILQNEIKLGRFYIGWYADPEMTKQIEGSSDLMIENKISKVYARSTYEFIGTADLLSKYTGKDEEIDLTHLFYDGKTVSAIDEIAFKNNQALKSIYFASTVKEIKTSAFEDCINLTTVVLPKGLTTIRNYAFARTRALKNIILPSTVTYIGQSAFAGCNSLETLSIPEGVTTIWNSTFSGCSSLKSITLPESLTSIGQNAFQKCSSLVSVAIPSKVQKIDNWAFLMNTSLKSIYIPKSVTAIGTDTFKECTSLTIYCEISEKPNTWLATWNRINSSKSATVVWNSKGEVGEVEGFTYALLNDDTITITEYTGNEKEILIPSSLNNKEISSINDYAFKDNKTITSIQISQGIKTIGKNAFYGMSSLTSVVLPDTIVTIDDYAFALNTSLVSINLPSSLEIIGGYAFSNCENLLSITIPKSVSAIGYYAFNNCTSLKIKCEIKESEKPVDWKDTWNNSNRPVEWKA